MAELKRCPKCGAMLRKKATYRWKEIVYEHPRNGCENDGIRVRCYKETVEAWNRRQEDETENH